MVRAAISGPQPGWHVTMIDRSLGLPCALRGRTMMDE